MKEELAQFEKCSRSLHIRGKLTKQQSDMIFVLLRQTVSVHLFCSCYVSDACMRLFSIRPTRRAGERRRRFSKQSSIHCCSWCCGLFGATSLPQTAMHRNSAMCTFAFSGVRTNLRVSSALPKKTRTSCPGMWRSPNDSGSAQAFAGGSGWRYRSESAAIAYILGNRGSI